MKNFLRSTLCMATVLGSGCASDMTELGDSTIEVKTETNVRAQIIFANRGTVSVTDGIVHVRDQTFRFRLTEPNGELAGSMELLHNADLELATNLGVGYGLIVSMDTADGIFAGDYAGDVVNTAGGQLFDGEFQTDATMVPRNRHLRGTFSNHATGSLNVFNLATTYTQPADH